jgi:hypothetical protein
MKKSLQDGRSLSQPAKALLARLWDSRLSTSDILRFVKQVYEHIQKSNSSMAMFWLSFMSMTKILMMNIHVLKPQTWEEFKSSI